MHGLLISERKELSEEQKALELESTKAAMTLLQDVISRKRAKDFSDESFAKCFELLQLNPELALAWNFRRQIVLSKPDSERLAVMKKELKVLNGVMVDLRMTKSYCLWNHRRWLLQQLRPVYYEVIPGELKLVSKILGLDARNFHAWSYRHWLRENFESVELDDIEYSKKLIEKDFSNYSAWFLRLKALTGEGAVFDPFEELETVWSGIFTEPTDQSVWQFHDWLVEKWPELSSMDAEYFKDLEDMVTDSDLKYLLLSKLRIPDSDRAAIVETLIRIDPMRKGYYLDQL
jgi:geranylgeranyl transferase type-2 subunit alpha